MISEHELLENGDKEKRCQVVRWVRTFPFSFLSKREYIIGRRMWRSADGCLYGITKVSSPPQVSAPHNILGRCACLCHVPPVMGGVFVCMHAPGDGGKTTFWQCVCVLLAAKCFCKVPLQVDEGYTSCADHSQRML